MRIRDWSSDVCASDLLIDGGVGKHPALTGHIQQRGFAKGAPDPSGHGTAVASLIVGDGKVKGAAPGAPLLVADIYGRAPAGGSPLPIARAPGWRAAKLGRASCQENVWPHG